MELKDYPPDEVVADPTGEYAFLIDETGTTLAMAVGTIAWDASMLPQPPTLTSMAPNHDWATNTASCTLTGTGFEANLEVLIDGVLAGTYAYVSATSATVTMMPHAAGPVAITVRNGPDGTASNPVTFTYD